MLNTLKREWFSNVRGDLLSGTVVALALIPEAIAFSIIAGVDPKVGLYASFCIAVIIAIVGGRPGMISAATGAMALLMVTLVKEHGLQYLLAASLLCGVIQIGAGFLKLGDLMRFVSRSVVTGFVNALAILIFMAQLPELTNVTWHVYAMTAAGLGIIYLFPYVPKVGSWLPSPLVCILTMTAVAIYFGIDVRTVADMGELPDTLPIFLWPDVPLTLETLWIILPYSAALAAVGLLESMMTATIVDELTDTDSDKNRECKGQGVANIGSSLLGGMAGCAMIGQSIINVKSGGRGRLSTFVAGLFLLIMVVFLDEWIGQIPMAALVAVMIMVSIGTFSWESVINLKKHPLSTNIVMLATVSVVVATHNLALGVLVGVLLASLFFANKIGRFMVVKSEQDAPGERTYKVIGQVFFASSDAFSKSFDFREAASKVTIDLTHAHFWDITSVSALDKVVIKFRREGAEVELLGMNEASATIVDRFGVHDKPEEVEKMMAGH
ncbi:MULTISPECIES: SulP family inorganic anion transporter [Thalassolituus]|mgnify:FL=1|uniref:SulP family inorganic anion transporter n=1 Tax=Thalassolituus TaxID=187492 RepID=UPI0007CFB7B5|nr:MULTISPECIES: SulP family inorganic anion transporter [Thalassolituus]KZZ10397.1 sodium-independent anion transporter [Oleibacter sp. HI0075]MEC8102776.1 SulP family inorganic anion transporter [Pseudomonadota bacterium]HCG77929.1 SulP family inorganic anion transporter [Oceanospirillales bacterium]MEC9255077.1 SulP family inorganic anion transporter [Pseudomonadota bacterium]MEE3161161.1 SulP family inorganic anion transporter [Pseudomonadota bacterium]|tara:strand:- start:1376 stop:2863 length:1488 start_codon:yes stop_codon:yes gene_type:complete